MTQKDAVFNAVSHVLEEAGIKFQAGDSATPLLTRALRGKINTILVNGFDAGIILADKKHDSVPKLRAYVSGLVSNWLRKDVRLNGGTKSVGSQKAKKLSGKDSQLKALRALMGATTDEDRRSEIQGFIDARVAELNHTA